MAIPDHQLPQNGLMDAAQCRFSPMQQADQCGEEGDGGDEGLGAINGVQHPDKFRIGTHRSIFLPDNPMVRKSMLDQLPHGLLGGTVGEGDWRIVVLDFEAELRIGEIRNDDFRARGGQFPDECFEGVQLHAAKESRLPVG